MITNVAHCPVPWCPDAGRHEWQQDEQPGVRSRTHRLLVTTTDPDVTAVMVTAGAYDTDLGMFCGSVEIQVQDALYERAEFDQLIRDLHRAAAMAFGPEPTSSGQVEVPADE